LLRACSSPPREIEQAPATPSPAVVAGVCIYRGSLVGSGVLACGVYPRQVAELLQLPCQIWNAISPTVPIAPAAFHWRAGFGVIRQFAQPVTARAWITSQHAKLMGKHGGGHEFIFPIVRENRANLVGVGHPPLQTSRRGTAAIYTHSTLVATDGGAHVGEPAALAAFFSAASWIA
jgi:hypothetical protein